MRRFTVMAVFEVVGDGKAPRGFKLLDPVWGPGMQWSVASEGSVSVLVDVLADSEGEAHAKVVRAVPVAYRSAGGTAALRPGAVRVQRRRRFAFAGRGSVGDGPPGSGRGRDDDGGTAGVREPRRPLPGPGHLTAVADAAPNG